mmetsp:Transcript_26023/g.77018  ORF Transcript_26023/g.77018 Transcript_26023/m.77018 type:complete len:323 (-) Transcript_26023:12-980(-)
MPGGEGGGGGGGGRRRRGDGDDSEGRPAEGTPGGSGARTVRRDLVPGGGVVPLVRPRAADLSRGHRIRMRIRIVAPRRRSGFDTGDADDADDADAGFDRSAGVRRPLGRRRLPRGRRRRNLRGGHGRRGVRRRLLQGSAPGEDSALRPRPVLEEGDVRSRVVAAVVVVVDQRHDRPRTGRVVVGRMPPQRRPPRNVAPRQEVHVVRVVRVRVDVDDAGGRRSRPGGPPASGRSSERRVRATPSHAHRTDAAGVRRPSHDGVARSSRDESVSRGGPGGRIIRAGTIGRGEDYGGGRGRAVGRFQYGRVGGGRRRRRRRGGCGG